MRSLALPTVAVAVCVSVLFLSSCGGASTPATPVASETPIGMALSATDGTLPVDGGAVSVNASVTRPLGDTANVTLTVIGAPSCVTAAITNPGTGNSGSAAFSGTGCTTSGTFPVTVQASDGTTSANAVYSLIIPVLVTVQQQASSEWFGPGMLNEFMATSFQPAPWDYQFFQNHPDTTTLNALHPHHVRLQPVEAGVAQKADKTWDFSTLNAILEPVASVSDKSPELQLATAPAWMCDSSGHLLPAHFADFAQYAAEMVEYYNTTTGFTDATGTHVHASYTPITYWGIFNEPNYNGLTADQYVTLYNTVVPVMQAAASNATIQFVGLELGDSFDATHQAFIDAFAANVTEHVDVIATHFYSTCNQADTDATVMASITDNFVPELRYLLNAKATSSNSSLANAPVWVTENNVNADYSNNGVSACNGGTFVLDTRGTSAFFAAWRPYVYSQFGKLGIQGLYHWDYAADQQYGEVDFGTANTYLSYWVDYYLQQYFCGTNPDACDAHTMLKVTDSEANPSLEALATQQSDGSIAILLANHAVASASDNNGKGLARTVVLQLSSPLDSIGSGTEVTIDATTNAATGPAVTNVAGFTRSLTVTSNGYGVIFLRLQPGAIPLGSAQHPRGAGEGKWSSPPPDR